MNMSVVQHNLLAMNSNRMLGITTSNKAKSTEKLSSGYKINRAADDAAGLSISEKMRRQIRGLTQGTTNAQDGVSLCQIADGALNETHAILQRMNELSVKAANGTLQSVDREYIQSEINQLVDEIDHIAVTTNFNDEVFPLTGGKPKKITIPGSELSFNDVILPRWETSTASMKKWPFTANDSLAKMNLRAVIDKPELQGLQPEYRLIYGDGTTNYSTISFGYQNPVTGAAESKTIKYSDLQQPTSFTAPTDSSQSISRTFSYSDPDVQGLSFDITQTVTLDENAKSYRIDTTFADTGSVQTSGVLFAQHFDTSYGGDRAGDFLEKYYSNGSQLTQEQVYTNKSVSLLSEVSKSRNGGEILDTVNKILLGELPSTTLPDSLSVANVNADDLGLPFSERINFTSSGEAFLAVGRWNRGDDLTSLIEDYGNGRTLSNIERKDMAFSYFTVGKTTTIQYGIEDINRDSNLAGLVPGIADLTVELPGEDKVWIQSGAEEKDGLWLDIVDARAAALGVDEVKVNTQSAAQSAISQIKEGLQLVSQYRTTFGAQQNRMEALIRNQNNIVENTTAAESRIRDTDMAKEMTAFSNHNVVEQAGQSMLAQANQSKQGILSLLG